MRSWDSVTESWSAVDSDTDTQREQQALLEHFHRAEQIFARIGRADLTNDNPQTMINNRTNAALVMDDQGQIIAANAALENWAAGERIDGSLEALLSRLQNPDAPPVTCDVLSKGAASQLVMLQDEPCLLVATPLPGGLQTVVDFSRAIWHNSVEEDLRTLFGLSLSEVAICHLLYEGYEAKEIANLRDRAEDTVRKQIKSIQRKTHCARQADLMRVLTGLLVLSHVSHEERRADSRLLNQARITLADGRDLYYYHLQPAGTPVETVVITHGIGSSPAFPQAYLQTLLQHNIAIVGVSRAGYGRSSPLAAGSDPVRQYVADLEALLSCLHLQQVNLISIQSGAMFNFAARAQSNRIAHMVCIAPVLPLAGPAEIAALPRGLKILARTKKYFPAFFPLLVQSVLSRVDAGNSDALYANWYRGVPSDLAVLEDVEARKLLDGWLRFCGAQGTSAYIADAEPVLSDWSALVDAGTSPVLLLCGAEDQIAPPARVADFVARHPHIQVQTLDGYGQLMLAAEPALLANSTVQFITA
ncbi:MAG: alpha/beta fold hydrolase [Pseudomonadales bacterium]